MSGQVKGFTEAQIREMATRGAALDGTRPSDRWHSPSGRWQGLAKIECGLQAS